LTRDYCLQSTPPEALRERTKSHSVDGLVLIEAGKYVTSLAGMRIAVRLQALGADFLEHALHRRVDRADREVMRLEIFPEHVVARARDRRHHAIGAYDDEPVGVLRSARERPEA